MGKKAMLGERPWTESSKIWYCKLEIKICFSLDLNFAKSILSLETSISSGRQKKESCFSVSF